jgi:hypothetical protein
MEQKAVMLLASAILGGLAIILTIIGVGAPGWNGQGLFNCGSNCPTGSTGAGVLLIISILALTVAVAFAVLFLRFGNPTETVKGVILGLFTFSAILIVIAYSSVTHTTYSYYLTVTAGILSFLSAITFTYWLDRNDITDAQ